MGSMDQGDVWLREPQHGLIVFELKGGNMAKNASHEQCMKWFTETQKEKKHANGSYGFLVTQRAGVGYPRAGEWWAYAKLSDLGRLRLAVDDVHNAIVRLTLRDLVSIIRG